VVSFICSIVLATGIMSCPGEGMSHDAAMSAYKSASRAPGHSAPFIVTGDERTFLASNNQSSR
jgi:hypothetical protein